MKKNLSLVLVTGLLLACGGSGNTEVNDAPISFSINTELEGVWLKPCGAADPAGWNTQYTVIEKTFSGNEIGIDIKIYDDRNCSIPALIPRLIKIGAFNMSNTITTPSGLEVKSLNISISKSSLSDSQNQKFDIYKIYGDIAHFGDNSEGNDGSSVSKRPDELNFNQAYYLQ